jgi:beta-N-acetylhexosaminidase
MRSVILGCTGPALSDEEKRFFAETRPFGLILFARNCSSPSQLRELCADFRAATGWPQAPVFIDQEGGRIQRMTPPRWEPLPAAQDIGNLHATHTQKGLEAARLHGRLLAGQLRAAGINVDCVPLLDVPVPGASAIIGNRAFSSDPGAVAALGQAQMNGLMEGGSLPVIKHIPGHGRALVDSHIGLPETDAAIKALKDHDFVPFRALRHAVFAMTAHVKYTAIDPDHPATVSRTVIQRIIRGELDFEGLLITDDLSMHALDGSPGERAAAAFAAGCDLALHCNGDMGEMRQVVENSGELGESALNRYRSGLEACGDGTGYDLEDDRARLHALLE